VASSIEAARDRRARTSGSAVELRAGFASWLRDLAGLRRGEPGRVTVHTLTLTRWVAVVGQLFTILFVHFSLSIELPLQVLLPAVLLSAIVNLALLFRLKATTRLPERSAAALYSYDILQLCYLLALTGGVQNPFTALILVPIALAAATLELRSTMVVTGLALLALLLLALEPGGLPWRGGEPLVLPGLLQLAIAAGLMIATVLIAVFVWSIAEAARRRCGTRSPI
jgi:two-component system sensor histidine kinase RegB